MGRLRRGASFNARDPALYFFSDMYADLYRTFERNPNAFLKGCGQETLVWRVREVTKRSYEQKALRRCLLAGLNLGLVKRAPDPPPKMYIADCRLVEYYPSRCSKFELLPMSSKISSTFPYYKDRAR